MSLSLIRMELGMTGQIYSGIFNLYSVVVSLKGVLLINILSLITGDFLLRSSSLNSLICKQLISLSQSYRNPASSNNPFGVFDYLRIYHPEEHTAVMETLAAVEKSNPLIFIIQLVVSLT